MTVAIAINGQSVNIHQNSNGTALIGTQNLAAGGLIAFDDFRFRMIEMIEVTDAENGEFCLHRCYEFCAGRTFAAVMRHHHDAAWQLFGVQR